MTLILISDSRRLRFELPIDFSKDVLRNMIVLERMKAHHEIDTSERAIHYKRAHALQEFLADLPDTL